MRRTAILAILLAASVSAHGQDAARPAATGTTLLDALPPQADVVVETPDLPKLLDAATKAGLGDAASWRAAFDAQLAAWGAGSAHPERLVRGGDALLAAADGEALVASIDVRLAGAGGASSRAALFAMRTTRDEKTLRAALADLVEGGLRRRYEGEPRTERIAGRAVVALPGNRGELYVLVQDGLVAACDQPLALGLFLEGLAKSEKGAAGTVAANRPSTGALKLVVRHGRGDAAWEGWAWGDGETVQWSAEKKSGPFRVPSRAAEPRGFVVLVGSDRSGDLPLMPAPLARTEAARREGVNAVGLMDDGLPVVLDVEHMMGASRLSEGGGASRLAWLRAYAAGTVEVPIPGVDPALLRGPCDAATKAAGDAAGEFVAWKTSDEPGKLNGPFGHGPATFLALRSLHDALRGIAPGAAAPPREPAPPPRSTVPLPPPTKDAKDH